MTAEAQPLRAQLEYFERKVRLHVAARQAGDASEDQPCLTLLARTPELFAVAMRLVLDDRVPRDERERLLAALLYVAAPADLLPEKVLGAEGYRDDLLVLALSLARTAAHVPPEVLAAHWAGTGDVRVAVGEIISRGEAIAGPALWPAIMEWVDR
jgi:uncharacterized membrane protein YkvA (DUF1232 family)